VFWETRIPSTPLKHPPRIPRRQFLIAARPLSTDNQARAAVFGTKLRPVSHISGAQETRQSGVQLRTKAAELRTDPDYLGSYLALVLTSEVRATNSSTA